MVYNYKDIEKFGDETFEWYKGMFLKERILHGEIMELLLESITPLQKSSKTTDYRALALLTLATRLFNDAEAVKDVLLRGLPSQAQMITRDTIECIMLFRLFLNNAELAKRWMMRSIEYQAGTVNTELLRMGVKAKEYAFYGILSHEGHANFLASISNVQEESSEEGTRRTFHFGSSKIQSVIYFVHHGFLDLFFLLHILLTEPLAEYYSQQSEVVVYTEWSKRVDNLIPKMESLVTEATWKSNEGISEPDDYIKELVAQKLRVKEFKKTLSGGMDETTKIE